MWTVHVVGLRKVNAYSILAINPSEKRDHLGDQGVEVMSEELNVAIVVPLIKREDKANFNSYGGTSL
jgi:hypothetical protein